MNNKITHLKNIKKQVEKIFIETNGRLIRLKLMVESVSAGLSIFVTCPLAPLNEIPFYRS